MAEFSGKIVSAFYANEEYDMVKIRWDDNGTLNVYHVPVDENNADFKALQKEGWDAERLTDETAEELRAQSNAFNQQVNEAARKLLEATSEEQHKNQQKLNQVLEQTEDYFAFMATDTDKDNLFKFKLWALETGDMKHASKEQKAKMRKAQSILEGFAILYDVRSSQ